MSIVVGVSPTTGSPAALRWAAEEARVRSVPLRAVLAWRAQRPPAAPGGRPPLGASSTVVVPDQALAAEHALVEFVEAALGSRDGVECTAVRGGAVNALLSAAQDADLLVIGEPRPGRLGSVLTSLVAPQVVLRSSCPVVVMPSASPAQP